MKDSFEIGTLGMVLVLGICAMTGCGVSTANGTKSTVVENTQSVRGTSVGQTAPDFELEKSDGAKIASKDLKGSPAVLVFWTAWCPACKEEAPMVNKLSAEFEAKGVKVIGINIGESDARISEGIKNFGIKYTVAKDKDTAVSKSYKVMGTPTVIFLDKNGVVQYFGNEIPADYSARLDEALKG